jgi:Uncharacterized protein conserved in bacteria (DUF2330)
MNKPLIAAGAALAAIAVQATTVFACGGLVAPDGDVRLAKATTFVAWHSGVEHYVTSFAYQGKAVDVGWIVPLPAVPSSIQPAGRWTLQRLEREVQPPLRFEVDAATPAGSASDSVAVVEQVQVEALDVTVLKGSGQAVIDWCAHNGFALNQETRDHLLRYAQGSPIFMAAKYDTAGALQRGLAQGDGVPLMLTMPTKRLWVPLEVLANDGTRVTADLFLLTDQRPSTDDHLFGLQQLPGFGSAIVDGATGFSVAKQEPMNDLLHADLSRDRNMQWVPTAGWLSYLTLNAPSDDVTYDLSLAGDNVIRLPYFGASSGAGGPAPSTSGLEPVALSIAAAGVVSALGLLALRRRSRRLVAAR